MKRNADPRAFELILRALNDRNKTRKINAAFWGIGEHSDARALPPLLNLLEDKNPKIVTAGIHGISHLSCDGTNVAIDDIVDPLVATYYRNNKVRTHVIRALAGIDCEKSINLVISALNDEEMDVTIESIRVLSYFKLSNDNSKEVADILICKSEQLLSKIHYILACDKTDDAKLNEYKANGRLRWHLEFDMGRNRYHSYLFDIIEKLGDLSNTIAIEPLAKLFALDNIVYKVKTSEALLKLGDARGLDFLAESLFERDDDEIISHRYEIASSLINSDDARIPDILLEAFSKITPGLYGKGSEMDFYDGLMATKLIAGFGKFKDKRSIELINKWPEDQLEKLVSYYGDKEAVEALKQFGIIPKDKILELDKKKYSLTTFHGL